MNCGVYYGTNTFDDLCLMSIMMCVVGSLFVMGDSESELQMLESKRSSAQLKCNFVCAAASPSQLALELS